MKQTFHSELEGLLNKYSLDDAANTPDFLLANMIEGYIGLVIGSNSARDQWWGVHLEPGHKYFTDSDMEGTVNGA